MVAGEHRVKGRGNAVWNKEGAQALLPIRSAPCAVPSQKIATWSAERASGPTRPAGAFEKRPWFCAVSALRSLTYGEGKEKREALAPRLMGRGR